MTDPTPTPDTGDIIDPDAADPVPEPVTHPEDPNFVAPYEQATPVHEDSGSGH